MVKRVRGSTTGRPIMVLLDLLGRRWTLRIVWELRDEPRRFRELQAAIGASPTIINTRLGELREAETIGRFFKYADGCIVGSSLKVDGYTWNPVDPERAKRFVDAARSASA